MRGFSCHDFSRSTLRLSGTAQSKIIEVHSPRSQVHARSLNIIRLFFIVSRWHNSNQTPVLPRSSLVSIIELCLIRMPRTDIAIAPLVQAIAPRSGQRRSGMDTRLQTSERRTVAWNATTGAFEHVCERCGTAGFIVERLRGEGDLERHAWCCDGEPAGPGWQLAEVRRLPFAFDAESAAAWLSNTDPDAQDEPGDAWVMPSAGHRLRLCRDRF